MRILVTGGAGYLGSVLVDQLLCHGQHEVTVLDTVAHGVPSLLPLAHNGDLRIVRGDARRTEILVPLVREADAVVALAAIVGAPACARDPMAATTTNLDAIASLVAMLSDEQTLIYPCTNSGYGIGGEDICTEQSPLHPVSHYGVTKIEAERLVVGRHCSYSLRFATLFGSSPRMRIDLMVNDFVYRAVRDHAIVLFEGGFRRNFLHVRDAASVILNAVNGNITPGVYNVGDSRANMTKRQLCEAIRRHVPGLHVLEAALAEDPDKRDYLVSNAKIEATGWRPMYTLDDGIEELIRCYQQPFETWRNA